MSLLVVVYRAGGRSPTGRVRRAAGKVLVVSPSTVEELCEQHQHLPATLSRWIAAGLPPYIASEELEPAAWDGLFQAATTYDPGAGVSFTWWAKRRIHGAIRDQLRSDDPMPRSRRAAHRAVGAARDALAVNLGRWPTDDEVADTLAVSAASVRQARAEMAGEGMPAVSVDHPAMIGMSGPGDVEGTVVDAEIHTWLRAAVAVLPDRQRRVIESVYWRDEPLSVMAAELGVTTSRVTQIHAEAEKAMRDALEYHLDGDDGAPLRGVTWRRRDAYRRAVADAYLARRKQGGSDSRWLSSHYAPG